MNVRSGTIDSTRISVSADPTDADEEAAGFNQLLKGVKIHEVEDFYTILRRIPNTNGQAVYNVAQWLNNVLAKTI